MKNLRKLIMYCFIAFLGWEISFRLFRRTFPFPAPALLGPALDSALRKLLQPPEIVITRSGIKPGMKILEVGCGSGCFTTCAARRVGKKGAVQALDINPKMLTQLDQKLARPGNADLDNITLHQSRADQLPFADNSLDLVFMVTVFPEISDKHKALLEIFRVLRPGGWLALSEFLPDPDYLTSSTTIKLVEAGGFKLEKLSGNIWNYTARFRRIDQ